MVGEKRKRKQLVDQRVNLDQHNKEVEKSENKRKLAMKRYSKADNCHSMLIEALNDGLGLQNEKVVEFVPKIVGS